MVDEGETHMQARPIIVDVPAYIGLALKRMAPHAVPHAAAALKHIGETSQHVRFLTIKALLSTVPGGFGKKTED